MTKQELIQEAVKEKIKKLSETRDTGYGKKLIASLRRSLGKEIGEIPEAYGFCISGLPIEIRGGNQYLTREEKVIFHTLSLYSFHQQGNTESNMNDSSFSFAEAVGFLASKENIRNTDKFLNRLQIVARANSVDDLVNRMRPLIQYLRSKKIGIDYITLAADLYRCSFPDSRKGVMVKWGREYFKKLEEMKDKTTKEKKNEQ